jgi:membrane protease YdiL (CAAX protease family)
LWLEKGFFDKWSIIKMIICLGTLLVVYDLLAIPYLLPEKYQQFQLIRRENLTLAEAALLLFGLSVLFLTGALVEEFIFRLFPLTISVKLLGNSTIVIWVAVLSSVIFGYVHAGWAAVPIQGVLGFALALVFLKCGGLQKRSFKAFFVCVFLHFYINMLITVVLLIEYFMK